jgi:hypothetical protein
MITALYMLQGVAADHGFWPVTGAGWLSFAASMIGLVSIAVAWGRWSQKLESNKVEIDTAMATLKAQRDASIANLRDTTTSELNRFGERLGRVESEQDHMSGQMSETANHVQRVLGQHDTILGLLGEARGNAIRCSVDTVARGEKIDRKLEALSQTVNTTKLELGVQLAGVQKELELMRRKAP